MPFIPKVKDRVYEKPIYKIKKDGTKGKLISHECHKCDLQKDKFIWFQGCRGNKYYAVCTDCYSDL